jgi:hypothetical protein
MSIEITLSHRNASDLNEEVADLFGRPVVARIATDVLLAELRVRMEERGCVLNVEPVRQTGNETRPAKRRRARTGADTAPAEASAGAA